MVSFGNEFYFFVRFFLLCEFEMSHFCVIIVLKVRPTLQLAFS